MTDKAMPERIFAWGANDLPRWSRTNVVDGAIEYVRADLVQGDPDEPLADGQYRWVCLGKTWHVAFVFKNLTGEGFSFELGHIERGENDIEKVGPVVKPPETELDERACPDSGSAMA